MAVQVRTKVLKGSTLGRRVALESTDSTRVGTGCKNLYINIMQKCICSNNDIHSCK